MFLDICSVFYKNLIFGVLVIILPVLDSQRFSRLFSTSFELLTLNLVYTCISSRWHNTSSLSFIRIETLWPILQPKICQISFPVFMAWKTIYIYILQICRHANMVSALTPIDFWPSGSQKTLVRQSTTGLQTKGKFSIFFSESFEMSIWNLVYTSGTTHWSWVSLQWGLLYSQK